MIETEGIRYSGSKNKLLPKLIPLIEYYNPNVVMDGFAGTTRVSQALKKSGFTTICNDINLWSLVFGNCYLLNRRPRKHYKEKIDYLNSLEGRFGWFSENYGGKVYEGGLSVQNDNKKRMWQLHNAMKLDAIRDEIDNISEDEIEKSVLLTSLILALDKVDNTVGHHAAFLKRWSPRSYYDIQLQVPNFIIDYLDHKVHQEDIFDLLRKEKADLYYFDPPYGSNNDKTPTTRVRYTSYYNIWKTVILNDKPELFGASGRREDSKDRFATSIFEEYKVSNDGMFIAEKAIDDLLESIDDGIIIFSYSNNGRVPIENLKEKFDKVFQFSHKSNAMKDMTTNGKWLNQNYNTNNEEYILIREK